MKFLALAAIATTVTAATVPKCANSDAITNAANQGEGGRCVTQTGFQFLQPVDPKASLTEFCANALCQSTWSKISGLVTDECLVNGVNIKKDVLDKLKGACDAPVEVCSNSDAIIQAANQGEGGRCVTQTGFQFLQPVDPKASLTQFCANPLCQSTWSKVAELVTKECLVNGVNVKKDVLDKLKGACDTTTTPTLQPCANADAIRTAANQGEGGRCVTQTGFVFSQPVAANASLAEFCTNQLCQSTWSKITELATEECLVDGVNIKKDVLDKLAGACDPTAAPSSAPTSAPSSDPTSESSSGASEAGDDSVDTSAPTPQTPQPSSASVLVSSALLSALAMVASALL